MNKKQSGLIYSFLIWGLLSFLPIAADLYQKSLVDNVIKNMKVDEPNQGNNSNPEPFVFNLNPSNNMFIVGKDGSPKIIYSLESNVTMKKTLMAESFSNKATTNPVEYKVEKISFENEGKKCLIEIKALPKFNSEIKVLNLTLGVNSDAISDNKSASKYLVAKNVEIKQQLEPITINEPESPPVKSIYKGKKLFLVAETDFYQNQKDSRFKKLLEMLGGEFKETFPDGIQVLKPKQKRQYFSSNFDQVINDANDILKKHSEIQRVFLFWANDDEISMTNKPAAKIKLISVGNSLDINDNIVRVFSASKVQDIKNNYDTLIESIRLFLNNDKIDLE